MRVPVLMFANEAAVLDGLLVVRGGGWSHFSAPIPGVVSGAVAGLVELDPTEQGGVTTVVFRMTDGEGHELGLAGSIVIAGSNDAAPGSAFVAPFAIPFGVELPAPTTLHATLSYDDVEVGRCLVPVIPVS